MRKSLKGRKRPDISKRMTGSKNVMYGKKQSEETKQKISETNKARFRKQLINIQHRIAGKAVIEVFSELTTSTIPIAVEFCHDVCTVARKTKTNDILLLGAACIREGLYPIDKYFSQRSYFIGQ